MEPKLPAPNFQPEQPPVSYEQGGEQRQGSSGLERAPEKHVEQAGERRAETVSATHGAPILPPVVAAPSVQPPVSANGGVASTATDDTPLVAADEDLIEKEWVDKAKKIVEETRDDPYRREQEVGKLQADYLRKRYGKELGAS